MTHERTRRWTGRCTGRWTARLAVAAVLWTAPLAAACSAAPTAPAPSAPAPSAPTGPAGPTAGASDPAAPGATAVLAFAGDVHFAGAAALPTGGSGTSGGDGAAADLGSAFGVLAGADIAVVNLETAVTTRGQAAPKQYTFRAPPQALRALAGAGVDAVTLANNHGMDYGRTGLADTLAAGREAGLPVLGAGDDAAQAYAPWTTTVHGVRVAVLAATDVLDEFAATTWPAGPRTPGLASAKDPSRLLAAVRSQAARADVVVVFLHWGVERHVCPTARQEQLARMLSAAGADVVVGSHAHVLQPQAAVGRTLVAYGLGNFHFYAAPGPGAASGVLTVTVDRGGVVGSQWHPATIRGGRPVLDAGTAAAGRAGELGSLCPSGQTR